MLLESCLFFFRPRTFVNYHGIILVALLLRLIKIPAHQWVSYTCPNTVVGFSIAFSLFNHTDILPISYAFLCPSFWHMDFIHKFCHFILTLPLIWNNCWPWHDIVLNIFLMNLHSSSNTSSKLYDTCHQAAAAAFAMVLLLQCLLAAVPDVQMHACMWHC